MTDLKMKTMLTETAKERMVKKKVKRMVKMMMEMEENTLVSNPRNCRLPVYVSFLFAPPRMSNSSLFVLPLIGAPSSFVLIRA